MPFRGQVFWGENGHQLEVEEEFGSCQPASGRLRELRVLKENVSEKEDVAYIFCNSCCYSENK